MKLTQVLAVVALVLVAHGQAQQTWPHLRAHFGFLNAFREQPRTATDLMTEGWIPVSQCTDGNDQFPGDRYIRSPSDKDLVLIFDGNGFIAGAQMFVPETSALNDQYFPFSTSEWYQAGELEGEAGYFTTVYFVDPNIICNGGRNQQEFEQEGTGDRILFQNGPTPNDYFNVPLQEGGMAAEPDWYEHKCFSNMGTHYFNFYYDENQPCDTIYPFQVVYDMDGNLNGFVFQHIASFHCPQCEAINAFGINAIVTNTPTCLLDALNAPGLSTLHMYVGDYSISCNA